MSSCKCFNQEVTGRSLIERLPASTCQCTSKARLMVEENGRKFVLIVSNWKNVEKIKVDGALICNQEKEKCDYFFFYYPSEKTKNDRHAYFVELKGKNIGKAMSQIISTIQCFMQEGLLKNISLQKAFIVSSRFPQKDRTTEKLQEDLRKKYKCPLVIKNNMIEYRPQRPVYAYLLSYPDYIFLNIFDTFVPKRIKSKEYELLRTEIHL